MEKKHVIETVEELRQKFSPVENVNKLHKQRLNFSNKIALWGISHVGTMEFFYLCIVLVTLPLIFPSILLVVQYISSGYLQLILLPLIMVGQNLQGTHAELRAEQDYKTNVKAEKEIETILVHLENQQELTLEILKRIEALEKKK